MDKRSPLVSQHLENVSRSVLEEHQDMVREYVRHRQGVRPHPSFILHPSCVPVTSPSLAAARAVKHRTCNGWTFWQYQRSPGDWVPLTTLRK
jgi:hypothetical protein